MAWALADNRATVSERYSSFHRGTAGKEDLILSTRKGGSYKPCVLALALMEELGTKQPTPLDRELEITTIWGH